MGKQLDSSSKQKRTINKKIKVGFCISLEAIFPGETDKGRRIFFRFRIGSSFRMHFTQQISRRAEKKNKL